MIFFNNLIFNLLGIELYDFSILGTPFPITRGMCLKN